LPRKSLHGRHRRDSTRALRLSCASSTRMAQLLTGRYFFFFASMEAWAAASRAMGTR
jgi:hypothetical protein